MYCYEAHATSHAKIVIYKYNLTECVQLYINSDPSVETFWRQKKLASRCLTHLMSLYTTHQL